ncbi:phage terminase large subunit [uncultured Pontibacter sp.]|uniref:phage terminase large subunit n=1 Tax=uncultured Pontibacter sp. TaxID=453356 RepID=UPI0026139858|nr:phage terminase large subunit [uncultured Pontibacter sp.]
MSKKNQNNPLQGITAEQLEAAICKQSFYEFFKRAFKVLEPHTTYVDSPIIKYLCDRVQEEVERIARGEKKDRDLIVNVPPRTSKSLIFSVCLPAWVWTKYAHMRFITASYAATLSTKLALDSRTLIQSDWYRKLFPEVSLKDDANNKTAFETTARGARVSTSVGGTITGMGADIIIIDDPQKPDETNSEAKTEDVHNWYDNTIENRLNNAVVGSRIIVMQRLSEDDLVGYLLEQYPEHFEHICLPAELNEDVKPAKLKKYYRDGLFDPVRLGHSRLAQLKKKPYTYAGQYLQSPAPAGGGMFKRESFKIISFEEFLQATSNEKVTWHFFLDTAFTSNKKNDPTAIVVAAKVGNILYIRDVKTKHYEFPELMKFIKEYVPRYATSGTRIHIEGKASGQSLIQQLRQNSIFNLKELQPGKESKEDRAYGVTDFVESKRVVLIEGAYTSTFLDQVTIFPNSKNDDMVDAMVYAIKELIANNRTFAYGFS